MPRTAKAKYDSASRRWAGIGPYYAMFPIDFAERVVRRYTVPGDVVFDPFAGRGTAVFAAAVNQRSGIGIEINPVGYVYTRAKLEPAKRSLVEARIKEIALNSWRYRNAAGELSEFFRRCYCTEVREFLLTARSWLDWRNSRTDCTLMAFLLVHLHGKRTDSLSNQMRQTKSLSPRYAVNWWKANAYHPPRIDPTKFMLKKMDWRYARGRPNVCESKAFLGDSESRMGYVRRTLNSNGVKAVKLLLTSPPYCGITNYHYDQWLRLWLLGGRPAPSAPVGPNQGKFVDREKYAALLRNVFTDSAKLLSNDAVIYIRTDSRPVTLNATIDALRAAFPNKTMRTRKKPFLNPTQTTLFGGESNEDGEIDIVLK
jgi:DNA modification methylase